MSKDNFVLAKLDQIGPDVQKDISILLKGCFGRDIGLYNTPNSVYLLNFADSNNPTSLQALLVADEVGDKSTIWNVCASSFGKNSNSVKELMKWYLDQHRKRVNELFVDFYNPYWDKAIALYTSLGFGMPEPQVGTSNVKLTIVRIDDKEDLRLTINNLRAEFFEGLGFKAQYAHYPAKLFSSILEQLVDDRPKEYTGFFFQRSQDEIVIKNLSCGNLTDTEIYGYPTNCQPMDDGDIFFHTHPGVLNGILVQPPSEMDVSALFHWNKIGSFIKHYVFSEDGVYSFGFSAKTLKEFCDHPGENERIKDNIVNKYIDVTNKLTTLYYDPFRMLAGMPKNITRAKQNSIIIDYYLEEALSIGYPGKDFAIFDIKFWSRDFIKKSVTITDFLIWQDNCFGQVCSNIQSILEFNGGKYTTNMPLTENEYALILQMEKSEGISLQNFADRGLLINYEDREKFPEIWQQANLYSYKNISQLFTLVGNDNAKYNMTIALLKKQVSWNDIIEILQGKKPENVQLAYEQLAAGDQLDDQYIDTRLAEIEGYKTQIAPIREKSIYEALKASMSAFDVSQWQDKGRIGSVSTYGKAYALSSLNDPNKESVIKIFENGLDSEAVHEIGSYAILKAVGAKYVPKTYGLISDKGHFGIALERFSMSLDKIGTLDYTVVMKNINKILYQTRTGLAELHKCGLIHKDIKPANIFIKLSSDQQTVIKAVLADFGTASTPLWNAPEISPTHRANKKSDIWSLGTSIVDVIMGDAERPTYTGRYSGKLPQQALYVLDEKSQQIVENMIDIDPSKRKDIKATIGPKPNAQVDSDTLATLNVLFDEMATNMPEIIKQRTLSIAGRYIDIRNKTEHVTFEKSDVEMILLASFDIVRKWSNLRVKDLQEGDINIEWDILLKLNGLIYIE